MCGATSASSGSSWFQRALEFSLGPHALYLCVLNMRGEAVSQLIPGLVLAAQPTAASPLSAFAAWQLLEGGRC